MKSTAYRSILWGGLVAGILDLSAAVFVYGYVRGLGAVRILQSISAGILGADAYEGKAATALLGTLLHFSIAFGAAAVYFVASRLISALLKFPVAFGALYGAIVFAFMRFIVLPLSAYPHTLSHTPAIVSIGLSIHIVCIGLPISFFTTRYSQERASNGAIRREMSQYDPSL